MSLDVYLGIDVGSVTTKLALVDEKGKYIDSYMLKTAGKPVDAVQNGLKQIYSQKFRNLLRKSLTKCNNGELKRDIIENKCR